MRSVTGQVKNGTFWNSKANQPTTKNQPVGIKNKVVGNDKKANKIEVQKDVVIGKSKEEIMENRGIKSTGQTGQNFRTTGQI